MPQTAPTLVDAHACAELLGISVTTVYALVQGVRGWKRITPLPAHHIGKGTQRPRVMFDLAAVGKWRDKEKFAPKTSGRRLTPRVRVALHG